MAIHSAGRPADFQSGNSVHATLDFQLSWSLSKVRFVKCSRWFGAHRGMSAVLGLVVIAVVGATIGHLLTSAGNPNVHGFGQIAVGVEKTSALESMPKPCLEGSLAPVGGSALLGNGGTYAVWKASNFFDLVIFNVGTSSTSDSGTSGFSGLFNKKPEVIAKLTAARGSTDYCMGGVGADPLDESAWKLSP